MASSKKIRISPQVVDQIIDSVVWQSIGARDEGDELRLPQADILFRITVGAEMPLSTYFH